jgi:hypothetical protein
MAGTLVLAAASAAAAREPVCHVRGVPVQSLARAGGFDDSLGRWRILWETSRRLHATYGLAAPAAHDARALRAQIAALGAAPEPRRGRPPSRPVRGDAAPHRVPADVATQSVPLLLPPASWREAVLGRSSLADSQLVGAMLGDRGASLLYRGLAQLDPETLAFVAERPELLQALRRDGADAFSVFAGGLRVRGGRVDLPGGPEADPLWEELAGEHLERLDRFVVRLFTRDSGRLALLLDAIARLEPPARRFALGLPLRDPRARAERARALYRVFSEGREWWRPAGGAFARPIVDPARVLMEVRVSESGALAPPASRALWEAVFSGDPAPDRAPAGRERLGTSDPVDAPWLAEQVGVGPASRCRERLTQVVFAQRLFGDAPPDALEDVVVAVSALRQRPALVLALERMDVRDPGLYAALVRTAERIDRTAGGRVTAGLVQFQAMLALVERARWTRTLDASQAQSLLGSLAELRFEASEGPAPAVRGWLEGTLMPALRGAVYGEAPAGTAEQTAARALSGFRLVRPEPPAFEWEGLAYRALPSAAEMNRFERVRERQGGDSLDAALSFGKAAAALLDSSGSLPVEKARDLEEALRGLGRSAGPPGSEERALPELAAAVLAGARGGFVDAERARRLSASADALLADVLLSIVYAPHIGSPDGPALAGADVARRHSFGANPWALPAEVFGPRTPWRVEGSILALDTGLSRLALRRVSSEVPASPPGFDQRIRGGLSLGVALANPFALDDADRDLIAAAVEQGRERVSRLLAREDPAALAREAGLEAWRAQALAWAAACEPEALDEFFSLGELFWLGRPQRVPEGWGAPAPAHSGSLRLRIPPPRPFDDHAGRQPEDLLPIHVPDLALRVAVELARRRLPASLAPYLLAYLVQDAVDGASPVSSDDWLALAGFARELPAESFDDYLSALTGAGPLVAAPEADGAIP